VLRAPASARGLRLLSGLNALQVQGITLDFAADTALGRLSLVPGSTTWYATYRVPAELRIPYLFGVPPADTAGLGLRRAAGAEGYLDPANPRRYGAGLMGVEASIVSLEAAPPQPWRQRSVPGTFDTIPLSAANPARVALVRVPQTPAPADPRGMPVVIAISRITFVDRIPARDMVQYLTDAGEIRPSLLVVVPEPPASDEARRYAASVAFLADTVLPAVRSRYRVSDNPQDVIVTGTSRRGLVAAIAAVERPEAIGAVLALSGSFFWAPPGEGRYEWLAGRLAREPVKPIRWFLASGSLETVVTPRNLGHYMVATNRHLNDVLVARGYAAGYYEFAGVHHELNWEDGFAAGLRSLLRPR
jgi:enterochelin esterase family protein